MKTPREKYMHDANYKYLVDMMVNQIEACNYTPSEMREAALMASIIYEEIKPLPPRRYPESILKWLDGPSQQD